MTEGEAIAWLQEQLNVSRETLDTLETFVAFLKREAESQNLISASTLDHIWSRHIVDSAQLLLFTDCTCGADPLARSWVWRRLSGLGHCITDQLSRDISRIACAQN